MSSAVPFLIWLLCVGVAALIIGIFIRNGGLEWSNKVKEGFKSSIVITTCPAGSTTYITARGDTNCCDGDVVNKQCNGNNMCSLSPSIPGGLQSCSDWLTQEWQKRSERFCPKSIPNYFGSILRNGSKPEGCSASQPIPDGSAPSDYNVKMCKIYGSQGEELNKIGSCGNVKALDAMVCPIPTATKDVVGQANLANGVQPPALLRCTYIPPNGSSHNLPVNCFDLDRYKLFADIISKGDPKEGAKMNDMVTKGANTNVAFCPASKAYYIDRTLQNATGAGSCECNNLEARMKKKGRNLLDKAKGTAKAIGNKMGSALNKLKGFGRS